MTAASDGMPGASDKTQLYEQLRPYTKQDPAGAR